MAGSYCALYAQVDEEHPMHPFIKHEEWKKGYHLPLTDWQRGQGMDSARFHLAVPPKGYEWRELDGQFVLAEITTGVIAAVIVPKPH